MTNVTRTFTIRGEGPEVSVYFNPPIHLGQQPHCLGLVTFESYNTISTLRHGADKLYYGDNVITFKEGTYSVDDINNRIQSILSAQFAGEYEKKHYIHLTVSNITHKCFIQSSFEIDFKSHPDNIGSLLGFSPQVLAPEKIHESDQTIRLLDDHHVSITCNIITDVFANQESSHILHDFIIEEGGGYSIREAPSTLLYHPVSVRSINNITLRLVNKHNQLIGLQPHTRVFYKLHLKPV